MKRKVRLTESDLRGIIKRSVSRILRESDSIDDEGLSNSLVDFINNPVDVHKKDVDYNPSDDEINDAINQFNPDDFDLDFSNLDLDDEDEDFYDDNSLDIYDSRKIRGNRLTEGKLRSIVNKSVKKVLREFGSDGPDWEDIDAGDLPNYPGSVGGYSDHVISANDFDDIDVDSLEKYDDDDDINYDEIEMYDDLNLESKKRLGRVIRESVRKVLSESPKGVDPDNVVPQRVAEKYGFTLEYGGGEDGLELWGKDIIGRQAKFNNNGRDWGAGLDPEQLLKLLKISRFTSWSTTNNGMHVRITVEPDPSMKQANPFRQIPNRVGDYVSSGYGNENGAFFHNPKNGHNKQFKF